MENTNTTTLNEIKTLPLWKACLDKILADGIEFNKLYPTQWLEQELECHHESIQFGTDIRAINDALAQFGYYLSARGQSGINYVVVNARAAEGVSDNYVKDSMRQMARALMLFSGIRANAKAELTDIDKQRLDSKAQKTALRIAMMKAPKSFVQIRKTKEIEA